MSKTGITLDGIPFGKHNNKTHLNTDTAKQNKHFENTSDTPFHALILGAFSGNLHKYPEKNKKPYTLKPTRIDRDNFDEIMASISPTLSISALNNTSTETSLLTLSFRTLEDFEPDALYDVLDIFAELRSLRRRLSNNATFESAANEMNTWHINDNAETIDNIETAPTKAKSKTELNTLNDGNLLDNLISATEERSFQTSDSNDNTDSSQLARSLIQQIVAPYVIPAADPRKEEFIAFVDASISGLMNSILHHPDFQSLEASWRNLYLTVKKLRTNNLLKIFILDSSKENLITQSSGGNLNSTPLYKKMIEPYTDIVGGKPWSLIVGDYYFNDSHQDIILLETMGLLAQKCNATFVAGAKPEIMNCTDLGATPDVDDWNNSRNETNTKNWQQLRHLPLASHIALTFPRVLCRLPYGTKTHSIESFTFEEMSQTATTEPQHKNYLWGNAAYAILYLLAESYLEASSLSHANISWEFTPGEKNEINNLPAHHYEHDGETELKPCAEIYLTEKGGERLLENGVLPIWSILRSDSIRVGPFSSLHSSNTRIQGRWK